MLHHCLGNLGRDIILTFSSVKFRDIWVLVNGCNITINFGGHSIKYKNLFVWFKTEYFTFLSQENFEAELERNIPLQK